MSSTRPTIAQSVNSMGRTPPTTSSVRVHISHETGVRSVCSVKSR
jgi:hypothetical protein